MRKTIVVAALMTLALGSPGPAAAADGSVNVDVGAGDAGTKIGTATFNRSLQANGTETLTVHFAVPGGIDVSHVCLQAQPFSGRALRLDGPE